MVKSRLARPSKAIRCAQIIFSGTTAPTTSTYSSSAPLCPFSSIRADLLSISISASTYMSLILHAKSPGCDYGLLFVDELEDKGDCGLRTTCEFELPTGRYVLLLAGGSSFNDSYTLTMSEVLPTMCPTAQPTNSEFRLQLPATKVPFSQFTGDPMSNPSREPKPTPAGPTAIPVSPQTFYPINLHGNAPSPEPSRCRRMTFTDNPTAQLTPVPLNHPTSRAPLSNYTKFDATSSASRDQRFSNTGSALLARECHHRCIHNWRHHYRQYGGRK